MSIAHSSFWYTRNMSCAPTEECLVNSVSGCHKATLLEWKGDILPVFAIKVVVMDTYQHEISSISSISSIVHFFFESPYHHGQIGLYPTTEQDSRDSTRLHLLLSIAVCNIPLLLLPVTSISIPGSHDDCSHLIHRAYRHQGTKVSQVDLLSGC